MSEEDPRQPRDPALGKPTEDRRKFLQDKGFDNLRHPCAPPGRTLMETEYRDVGFGSTWQCPVCLSYHYWTPQGWVRKT